MAALILITCPKCKKQAKGPAELQGKRIRCKACGQEFAVRAPAANPSAAAPQKAAAKEAGQVKTKTPPPAKSETEIEKDPYKLSDIAESTRCPQCAAEMESPEAILCLNCGYNTRTLQRMTTIRTYAFTPLDWAAWLAPGILCALGVLAMIGLLCFFWIPAGMERIGSNTWWGYRWGPLQIYGSVAACLAGYFLGKFAYRRLVRDFRPPEKFKKATGDS